MRNLHKGFYFLLFLLFFLNVADVLTTLKVIELGGVEGNPLVGPTIEPVDFVIKFGGTIIACAAFWACMRAATKEKREDLQWFIVIIVVSVINVYFFVVSQNWKMVQYLSNV